MVKLSILIFQFISDLHLLVIIKSRTTINVEMVVYNFSLVLFALGYSMNVVFVTIQASLFFVEVDFLDVVCVVLFHEFVFYFVAQ